MLFKTLKKGFTLIELLIVIVIIGILAVAILSAINPIEQINKANDAGRRSDSAELLNALERYYTSYQQYPWQRTAGWASPMETGAGAGQPAASATATWLSTAPLGLIGSAEMKPEFLQRDSLTGLFVYYSSATQLVHVCYDPVSTANSNDASFTSAGVATAAGLGTYMCVPE